MVRILFWNARGLKSVIYDLLVVLDEMKVDICCISETRSCMIDFATNEWQWVPGKEYVPSMGNACPRLGLGVLVNKRTMPRATLISSAESSMWVRVAEGRTRT